MASIFCQSCRLPRKQPGNHTNRILLSYRKSVAWVPQCGMGRETVARFINMVPRFSARESQASGISTYLLDRLSQWLADRWQWWVTASVISTLACSWGCKSDLGVIWARSPKIVHSVARVNTKYGLLIVEFCSRSEMPWLHSLKLVFYRQEMNVKKPILF